MKKFFLISTFLVACCLASSKAEATCGNDVATEGLNNYNYYVWALYGGDEWQVIESDYVEMIANLYTAVDTYCNGIQKIVLEGSWWIDTWGLPLWEDKFWVMLNDASSGQI